MNDIRENILYQGRPSWLNYYLLYVIGTVLFVIFSKSGDVRGGFFILLFIIGLAALFRFRYLFTITDDRIITRVGLIARNTTEMRLKHIRTMMVRQNPIERILGIGNLISISAAEGEAAVVFKGIRDPQDIKEKIRSIQGG